MKLFTISLTFFIATFFCPQTESKSYLKGDSNKNHQFVSKDKEILSFSSSVKFGNQKNQLTVFISTDFDGNNSMESIKKATWESLDKKISLAEGEDFVGSGDVDITKIIENGKLYYIAFRYLGEASKNGKPSQRTWQIKDVKVSGQNLDEFNIVNNLSNTEGTGWKKDKNTIVFRPNKSLEKSEGWVIFSKTNP